MNSYFTTELDAFIADNIDEIESDLLPAAINLFRNIGDDSESHLVFLERQKHVGDLLAANSNPIESMVLTEVLLGLRDRRSTQEDVISLATDTAFGIGSIAAVTEALDAAVKWLCLQSDLERIFASHPQKHADCLRTKVLPRSLDDPESLQKFVDQAHAAFSAMNLYEQTVLPCEFISTCMDFLKDRPLRTSAHEWVGGCLLAMISCGTPTEEAVLELQPKATREEYPLI